MSPHVPTSFLVMTDGRTGRGKILSGCLGLVRASIRLHLERCIWDTFIVRAKTFKR